MAKEASSSSSSSSEARPPLLLRETISVSLSKTPIIIRGVPVPRRGKENSDPRRSHVAIHVVDDTALIGSTTSVKREKKTMTKKKKYSRKVLEALRFADVAAQRRMWTDVHVGLGPTVRKDYDFLLHHPSPPLHFIGGSGSRGRLSEVKV